MNSLHSTPRVLIRLLQNSQSKYVLRPVYVAPRPGVESKPVSLREIWERRNTSR